uniref:Uncharacterized protein n=1 Tax=Anguilla anguilla TaxID=7936 RepID=A0A0E9PSH7_ANGAN
MAFMTFLPCYSIICHYKVCTEGHISVFSILCKG